MPYICIKTTLKITLEQKIEITEKLTEAFGNASSKFCAGNIQYSVQDEVFINFKGNYKDPSSISGYLLEQSYYSYDRMDNFNNKANNTIKPKEIKEEDILELRVIGKGTQSNVILYYYIEYEKLVVIKKYSSDNPERE